MRGEEFLEKLELIDPAFVEAAEIIPQKKKIVWIKWVAAAACICLAVLWVFTLGSQEIPLDSDSSEAAASAQGAGNTPSTIWDEESEQKSSTSQAESSPSEGVTIPPMQPSLSSNPMADMIGFFIYEGRCYVQQFEPIYDGADLIGERLGTATGLIDEWTEEDGYVNFAGSVFGNFYAMKGYDPSFMLCMRDPTGIVRPYICNNGITLNYGSELYEDRLHLSERFTALQYETRDSWYYSKGERYQMNSINDSILAFMEELDAAQFVPSHLDELGVNELYHLYFLMEDGTTVHLRLYEDGYVRYDGIREVCLQIPEESYQDLLNTLDSRSDSTAVGPPKTGPTLEDCLSNPELGNYLPTYTPSGLTLNYAVISYYLDEETAGILGTKEIILDYGIVSNLGDYYSVTVTWADEYEEMGWTGPLIDAADLSVETLSNYVELMIADMADGTAVHTETLDVTVRYGEACVILSTYGLPVETAYDILSSVQ